MRKLDKGPWDGHEISKLRRGLDEHPDDMDEDFLAVMHSIEESDRASASRVFRCLETLGHPGPRGLDFCPDWGSLGLKSRHRVGCGVTEIKASTFFDRI